MAPITNDPSPFRLLFVCTGNTCRSPMAEGLARREIERLGWRHVEVASAGVAAARGEPASEGAFRAARARGIDLAGHSSRPLTQEEVARADLVLAMSPSHLARADELGAAGRVHLLSDFASGSDDAQAVPDPFGGDDRVYEETLEKLDELVTASLRRLAPILAP